MKFVVDENLPVRAAAWLRAAGYEAWHVSELGLLGQSDDVIWAAVCDRGAYVVTRDKDFLNHVRRRPAGGVIRVLIGNCPTAVLIARLEALWPEIERRAAAGETLMEVG